MRNMYEAQFLETLSLLTQNAAFLHGRAWPRSSSPVRWPPWGPRATSPIQGCLKPFLECRKEDRFYQCQESPEISTKVVQQSQKQQLEGEPKALGPLSPRPLCDSGEPFPQLGSAFLLGNGTPIPGSTPCLVSVVEKSTDLPLSPGLRATWRQVRLPRIQAAWPEPEQPLVIQTE